jgi:hypothetical protein
LSLKKSLFLLFGQVQFKRYCSFHVKYCTKKTVKPIEERSGISSSP